MTKRKTDEQRAAHYSKHVIGYECGHTKLTYTAAIRSERRQMRKAFSIAANEQLRLLQATASALRKAGNVVEAQHADSQSFGAATLMWALGIKETSK